MRLKNSCRFDKEWQLFCISDERERGTFTGSVSVK